MTTTARLFKISSVILVGSLTACASNPADGLGDAIPSVSSVATAVPPQSGTQIIPGSLQDFQQNVGDLVHFSYDRFDLDEQNREILRRQAAWLARYPSVTLVVEGHADERGTREYNLALSARRAASVREYLADLGMSANRLETISYGKERPSCTQSSEACWSQNRRSHSVIKTGALS